MGLGEDILERKKPAIVKGLDDLEIVQVECGGMHTVALANNGKVMAANSIIQTQLSLLLPLQVKFKNLINFWQPLLLEVRNLSVTHNIEMSNCQYHNGSCTLSTILDGIIYIS